MSQSLCDFEILQSLDDLGMPWASNTDSEGVHSRQSHMGNAQTMKIILSCYVKGMEK